MGQNPPKWEPQVAFGDRLRTLRKRHPMSLAALAGRMNDLGYPIDKSTLARLERGEVRPTVEHLLVTAAALDVSPVHLLFPADDETTVSVGQGHGRLDVPANLARNWFAGAAPRGEASGPLRLLAGAGEPADIRVWLSAYPVRQLEHTMRQMGLDDDQIKDAKHSLETGEIHWPSGDPRIKTKEEDNG